MDNMRVDQSGNLVSKEWSAEELTRVGLVEELARVVGWVGGRVNKSGWLGWWKSLKCDCMIRVFLVVILKFMIIHTKVANKFIVEFS